MNRWVGEWRDGW